MISTDLNGAFYLTRGFLQTMRQQGGGTVINIVSDSGWRGNNFAGVAYIAAKFGLRGLTEAINAEERQHGIRATSIYPGEVNTPILDRRPVPPPPEAREKMLQVRGHRGVRRPRRPPAAPRHHRGTRRPPRHPGLGQPSIIGSLNREGAKDAKRGGGEKQRDSSISSPALRVLRAFAVQEFWRDAMQVIRVTEEKRARSDNPAFVGAVLTQDVVSDEMAALLRVTEVTFPPGARNKWHMHAADQVLIVTAGRGDYRHRGGRAHHHARRCRAHPGEREALARCDRRRGDDPLRAPHPRPDDRPGIIEVAASASADVSVTVRHHTTGTGRSFSCAVTIPAAWRITRSSRCSGSVSEGDARQAMKPSGRINNAPEPCTPSSAQTRPSGSSTSASGPMR